MLFAFDYKKKKSIHSANANSTDIIDLSHIFINFNKYTLIYTHLYFEKLIDVHM